MNKELNETPWHWTGTKTQLNIKKGALANRQTETITITILTGTGGESCHKNKCKNRKKNTHTKLWRISICTKTQTNKGWRDEQRLRKPDIKQTDRQTFFCLRGWPWSWDKERKWPIREENDEKRQPIKFEKATF